jgi:hypothetical protein
MESIILLALACRSFLFIEKVMEFSGSVGASGLKAISLLTKHCHHFIRSNLLNL